MSNVIEQLNEFNDPRDPEKVIHPLSTILFISICAIFCGAEGWDDIILWAELHKDWLNKHVDLSNGLPSYSTVRRAFIIIYPSCWGKLIREVVYESHPNKVVEDQDDK